MAYVHASVNEMSRSYLSNERRYNYTTPKSFLEQIKLYQNLLLKKEKELTAKMERLENGLQKLSSTSAQVRRPLLLSRMQSNANIVKVGDEKNICLSTHTHSHTNDFLLYYGILYPLEAHMKQTIICAGSAVWVFSVLLLLCILDCCLPVCVCAKRTTFSRTYINWIYINCCLLSVMNLGCVCDTLTGQFASPLPLSSQVLSSQKLCTLLLSQIR